MNFCNSYIFLLCITRCWSFVDWLEKSSCSPYVLSTKIDIVTNYEYVEPCPAPSPCQCLCDIEHQRLWIDCFNRQLRSVPVLTEIPTNNSVLVWNFDLSFNLFRNLNISVWKPTNIHINHFIFSGSLAFDLIVHMNLMHRHLVDAWPDHKHLTGIHDDNEHDEIFYDDEDVESLETEDKNKQNSSIQLDREHIGQLTSLTLRLRSETEQIKTFALSLAGEPSAVSILYLDHNNLDSVPVQALYNATMLNELYLSYNKITHLPSYAFGFSHRLTRLDLSHNQISSLDILVFRRHPTAFAGPFLIDYLDLSHNQISFLEPEVFSYLVNLRFLKLEHNQLISLSADLWTGLYRLKHLDLSHNYIENLTHAFYNSYLDELQELKLSFNNINDLGSCEFLSLKSLRNLNLGGNNLSSLDTCTFYGLSHVSSRPSFHVYLRSNNFETLHPCAFTNFASSTIHVENNPLICNCSINYLLHDRKSLAYTGQECRGGFAYQPHIQSHLPAIRKGTKLTSRKITNNSITCANAFKHYNSLCSRLDCTSTCLIGERSIIQITTVSTPSKSSTKFQPTLLPFCIISLLHVI